MPCQIRVCVPETYFRKRKLLYLVRYIIKHPNMSKFLLIVLFTAGYGLNSYSQCNQSLFINSFSSVCNGDGTSTVTINITVLFGNGNNSATISYDIGGGNVTAIILEDDSGDIIDQTYMFDVPSCENYSVTLTAWTNPSGSGSSCSDPPPVTVPIDVLPVVFGNLNIKRYGSVVKIEWSTYTEVNNDKFEIQRSWNNLDFQMIGEVEGNLNSNDINYYEFEDKLSIGGLYYYRIKQIDLDGQFSYSDLAKINFGNNSSTLIYPNPANDFISIPSLNQGHLRIFNTVGEIVKEIDIMSDLIKDDNIKIDISSLDIGLYFLISGDGVEKSSFTKI